MSPNELTVEQRAIECAHAYAHANGWTDTGPAMDQQLAIGLVLVGMVIGAELEREVAAEMVRDYKRELPQSEASIDGWVAYIEGAARKPREART